jgi:hypothetical protein
MSLTCADFGSPELSFIRQPIPTPTDGVCVFHMQGYRSPTPSHTMQYHEIASASSPIIHIYPQLGPHPLPDSRPSGYDSDGALLSWKRAVDDTTAASLTPCLTGVSDTKTFYSAIEVADGQRLDDQHSSPAVGADNMAETSTARSQPAKETTPKSKKTRSRASSTSQRAPRSASSSTAGYSGQGRRRSAGQVASRSATSSQAPSSPPRTSVHMSQKKRDDLLALHRDSCRVFQETGLTRTIVSRDDLQPVRSYTAPSHPARYPGYSLSSNAGSPTTSPVLRSQRSPPFAPTLDHDGDMSDEELLSSSHTRRTASTSQSEADPQQPYEPVPVPATVIDWTSPTTRRREYEKIDRSNRGFRRIWRSIAPRCFRSSDARTPFFEEGKDGKGNHEGSVRRFRMDIPDEKDESSNVPTAKDTLTHDKGGRWSCF